MKIQTLILFGTITLGTAFNAVGTENAVVFNPVVLWGNSNDKGVMLIKSNEMLIIDSKGNKYGKVLAKDAVHGSYMSPDGKKLAYTTAAGVWLVKFENKENYLVSQGYCGYLRWSADSSGFLFMLDTDVKDRLSPPKLFWADENGKNIKQIYP